MITGLIESTAKAHRGRILTAGLGLSILIFVWEIMTSRAELSLWVLIPFVVGSFLLDIRLEVPLTSGRLPLYHVVIAGTLVTWGPANTVFVIFMLLGVTLARTYYRFKTQLAAKLLEVIPVLLSVWMVERLYVLVGGYENLVRLGYLFPAIFLLTGYYLLWTLLNVTRLCLIESSVAFFVIWKRQCLIQTLFFLSVAIGMALVNYFTQTIGVRIALLLIPFVLFAASTYQIYASNLRESSRRLSEHSQLQASIIETLALAIDAKDHTTHSHVRRVQAYALGIAQSLGIDDEEEMAALQTAALLHDIGKLAIPEYILSKPGRLTDIEFAKMVKHVEIGANILEPIPFPYPVVSIIRHHHERHDGTGYPYGLQGEAIPLGSRILAVADCFDALTAPRPYRDPMSPADAIALIRRDSGTAFDPLVVRAFLRVAQDLAQQVSLIDTDKYANNTHLPQSEPDSPEEQKLWLRKKSFTEIGRTQQEIFSLYEIFQTLGKSLNAEDTMRIISVKLKSLFPYDSCVIYLKNKKTDTIYPAMVTGDFAETLQKNWIKQGEGLTGYVVAFNQPVVNLDPSHDFQHIPYLEMPHTLVNALVFPLQHDNRAYGAIALYASVQNNEVYSEDHVRLMETISTQAAISIHNALWFESYEENSLTDPLTGLPNSRYMFMAFEQNARKAERFKERMVVLVMDLNHFKEINDQYGHQVGDEVLIKVSEVLQRQMRKYDICIRYAGDEFVAFLYNADRETAEKIVARIKKAVQSLVIQVRSGKEVRLGVSIGMSNYPDDGTELNQLFTLADSEMYSDKATTKTDDSPQVHHEVKAAIDLGSEIQFSQTN